MNKNIEDIYPLSPLQEGIMFHTLYEPGVGMYFEQFSCVLRGKLNVKAFKGAWEQVVKRHAVFRTSFGWEGLKKAHQIVHRTVKLPWEERDWRELREEDQKAELGKYLKADRERGFELTHAPLTRIGLFQLSDDAWRCVWSHHHILIDGWCLSLVFGEVLSYYEGLTRGEVRERERVTPYREFIGWLQRQDMRAAEKYWREKLKGFEAPTRIGGQRGDGADTEAGEVRKVLKRSTTEKLQLMAREKRVTMNTVVQGAWGVLLSRYSGMEDVVFGVTMSGRPPELPGVEKMIGLFINTLPLRVKVSGEQEVWSWLQVVQEQQVEMRKYEYSPLVEVQGWSEVPRGTSLFESLSIFENYPMAAIAEEGRTGLMIEGAGFIEKANYPLVLVAGMERELWIKIEYKGQFARDTAQRLLEHLDRILEGFVKNPARRLSELELLSEAEREQILVKWNDTAAEYPTNKCIHELFEEQVERTPGNVAVGYEDEQLTYRELNDKSNQLAHYLRKLGVGPEVCVGICVERSLEMVIGLLGILKAGGVYVPLDPGHPLEQLTHFLEDAQIAVLVTQRHVLERFVALKTTTVCLDDWAEEMARENRGNPIDAVAPENRLYVIYTSGSTGRPKGAGVYHRGFANLVHWFTAEFGINAADKILLVSSLSFDLTQKNLFATLIRGGQLYLLTAGLYDPVRVVQLIAKHDITLVNCTPSAFYPVVECAQGKSWREIGSLRCVFLGGESIAMPRLRAWMQSEACRAGVENTYGPTECTDIAAFHRTNRDNMSCYDPIPIGRPISNVQLIVMDRNMGLCPPGVCGEICIGGAGVGAGYVHDAPLTAKKFFPNPFKEIPGSRLYRTGDMGRYLPDGKIEFLGRRDEQIKLRGYRIELREIESILAEHPSIKQAMVVLREDEPGEKRLAGYVVLKDGGSVTSGELRRYLKGRLPEYMVPAFLVILEELPLTSSGKVNRKALPAPEEGQGEGVFLAPRRPSEELMAGIFQEVLKLERVGVHDNFFEFGGHSLLAMQVVTRVRSVFKVELTLRGLFESPTVAELSERVEELRRGGMGPVMPDIRQLAGDRALPLSFAQERLWFIDQLQPGSTGYNIPAALRITGALKVSALEGAINETIRRHETLRTTFQVREGEPVQVIGNYEWQALAVVDLTGLPEMERELTTRQLIREESERAFDLSCGPLVRVKLLQLSSTDSVIAYTLHHIISDGWSTGVLNRELGTLYEAFANGQPSPLAELPVQYRDFAIWQREWLKGEVMDRQWEYWKDHLAGMSPLQLPVDHSRPVIQTFNGATEKLTISPETAKEIKGLCRDNGVTLFMTLLAGFQVLLSRYSRHEDIVVGSPIANRNRAAIEGLIGFFANTLVLRTDLSGDPTVRELLRRVREVSLGAYEHQYLPFEKLVEKLQPERNLSHNPLVQVELVLQNMPDERVEMKGIAFRPVERQRITTRFDLQVDILEQQQGLAGWLTYNTDLFEAGTIGRMARHLERILEGFVKNPGQRLSELEIMSQQERRQLLEEWNETRREYTIGKCVHQLIEEQVEKSPEAVAVVYEGLQLTYEELNDKSNRLAHYLRKLGVEPEACVGIYAQRSLEMVIGLLGILKAGAAYVPLDVNYPDERLGYMLRDARVKVLLTQEKLKGRFAGYEGAVVYLDQIEPLRAEKKKENLSLGVSEKNLAYVLYTSGSSGKPKGVSVEHRQIINYLYAVRDRLGLAGGKGYAFISTFAADLGNTMIYPCLCSGGCLHVISEEAAIDPKKLSEYFVANKVDYLKITPSHLLALQSGLHSLAILPRERLILGGEASSYAWVEKLVEMAPDCSVFNHYGPTETTVGVLTWEATRSQMSGRVGHLPLGRPLGNTDVYILDELGRAVPIGVRGELYIGGEGVTRGYLGRPDLTAEKFLPNPFSDCVGSRLYRSGDSARYLADGNIEFLGRIDQQMKLRGYRVELEEIESVLGGAGGVKRAAVVVREDELGPKKLVGYIVMEEGCVTTIGELRSYLQRKLPEHMVPDAFVILESLPLTANGKIDRKALPAPQGRQAEVKYIAPRNTLEKLIAGVWRELLNMEEVGIHDNFFELGGHSLLLARVHGRLEQLLQREFAMVELFQYPTISRLAEHLTGAVGPFLQGIWGRAERQQSKVKDAVAIIGLVGRFPGARNIEEFWRNLQGGVESISFFTDDELMAAGIDSQVLHNPNYVKAQGVMEDADLFDAEFFGYSPGEAELIDPQQRIFLECAWEALEQAGYHAESYGCAIGVYAGMSRSSYILNLLSNRELMSSMGVFQVTISNDKDFLSTRVSYKLNLKGPSVGVQTSCSTSLVAVQMACESLLAGKCDMALAGGVSVGADQLGGYYYQSEGIVSPDGHCRVFDARAQGMVRGNGVGIVVLKRLSEALAEGDTIHAVIKGSAINNDGSMKVGYTAPSVNGQAEVIALAQALGGVEARSISYVEAHGTGTALGDPIEIAALTQAFGASTKEKGFCAIGAVKSNIGHLDVAAGVAGLIKTVLALKHQKIPASLHYEQPNPKIDFANSPFYVNARLSEWKNDKMPRRAGVSSFGIGGTNAHVVVEEAPELQPSGMSRPHQLWVLSARSESALEQATKNLLKHLTAEPEINLADAAYTLQVGRKKLGKRRVVVGAGREQTIEGLTTLQGVINGETAGEEKAVVFLFSGQGAQYEKMGWGLYQQEIVFREEVDRCSERLKEDLGVDLRAVMYPGEEWGDGQDSLKQTWLAQPALFVLGYALAKLWKSWGIEPQGMIGHSIGEYIAACLAGVFTVEEGLKLVALRGRLMQAVPPGTMISVGFSEVEAQTFLQEAGAERCVSVAAVNGPKLSVLSGPAEAVEKLKVALTAAGVAYQLIETSHAFHSGMLDGVVDRFVEEVRKVKLRPPTLPYLSNVTGKWITKEEAIDPEYWGRHLRQTVRFSEGLQELLKGGEKVLLEVGPGRMLSSLAKMHFGDEPGHVALSTLRHRDGQQEDQACLLESLGRLWLLGVNVKWDGFYAGERRRRIPLPTYPFERKRYYVEPQRRAKETPERSLHKNQRVGDWFYAPSWKRNELFQPQSDQKLRERRRSWLLFLDEEGVGLKLAQALEVTGQVVTIVKIGTGFGSKSPHEFTLNPGTPEHYLTLLKELCLAERKPDVIVHLWCVTGKAEEASGSDAFERSQALGFYSLLFLAQAIGEQLPGDTLQLTVVSTHVQKVTGDEKLSPEKATVLGPCRVIPQEYANIQCTSVDIALPGGGAPSEEYEHGLLLEEITQENPDVVVAHRGGYRWVQTFESMTLQPTVEGWAPRENGVYIITGGLGGIGLVLAEHLAKAAKVKLVLIGRTIFPERNQWQQWLDTHGEANRTSSKIRKIQALERFGTEVCVVNADITDRTRMQAVAKDIADRFGTVHGIIHAAGVAGGGIIQLRTREAAAKVLAPKVEGTLILGELFRDVKLDFFVLCSSLNSFLGGIGGADYCAANAFLDAYAQQRGPATRVVAVNWDVWQEVGMAVNTEVPAAFKDAREKHLQSGILPAEGQEVFSRVLESRLVQVAIATRDLVGQIAEWRARKLRAEKEPVSTAGDGNRPAFDRPQLSSIYIPPGNPTEQTIAEIWQKLLAIKNVGIHDNFFELGGHSLLLIQMLPFLKKAFTREFTVAMLFQRATIHSLSTAILEGNSQPVYQKSRSRGERRKEKRAQMAVHSKVSTKQ